MQKLDETILRACTKFAHWFQRQTGRTCYFIAKIGLILTVSSISVSIMSYALPILPKKPSPTYIILLGLLAVAEIFMMVKLDGAEKEISKSAEQTKPFPEEHGTLGLLNRMFWFFWVIFTTLLTVLDTTPITIFTIVADTFFSLGLLIFHYFVVVNPLPPCKGKIKELAESIAAYLSPARPAEAKAP